MSGPNEPILWDGQRWITNSLHDRIYLWWHRKKYAELDAKLMAMRRAHDRQVDRMLSS